MQQMISLIIGSINQATNLYQQAQGEGVSLVTLDESTLEYQHLVHHPIANPSFISVNPATCMIYATQELAEEDEGWASALSFSFQTGEIELINRQPTGGKIPAHNRLTRNGRFLLVANYGSDAYEAGYGVCVLPILPDGTLGSPCSKLKIKGPTGPVSARQQQPHAHMVLESIEENIVWIADLGLDRLIQCQLDQGGQLAETARITMPAGSGPRHLAQHPAGHCLYVVGELDSTVSTLCRHTDGFELRQTVSTIESQTQSYAAEIQISSDGNFLYVSNRGEDSIACFAIDLATGLLQLRQIIDTGGKTPRHFTLTPTGQHLLVAHQNSDEIVIFHREVQTGLLTATDKSIPIANAVCVQSFKE